jgi:hypothetical protein
VDLFKEHFAAFADSYILIGGGACDLLLAKSEIPFRATKDLDIVLCVESMTSGFGRAFWEFVESGGYATKEQSSGKRLFYRFSKPAASGYPEMMELFSRVPDGVAIPSEARLSPVPMPDDVSSLSAILLDDGYYRLIQAHRIDIDGIPAVSPECLIVLKAKAWVDLMSRSLQMHVDSRDIRKHKNDIFRLLALIPLETLVALPPTIRGDMASFLNQVEEEPTDLKPLGLAFRFTEAISGLRRIFGV